APLSVAPASGEAATPLRLQIVQQEVGKGIAAVETGECEEAHDAVVSAIEAILIVAQGLAAHFELMPAVTERQVVAILKIFVGSVAVVGSAADCRNTVADIEGAHTQVRLAAGNPQFRISVLSQYSGDICRSAAGVRASPARTRLVDHGGTDDPHPIQYSALRVKCAIRHHRRGQRDFA